MPETKLAAEKEMQSLAPEVRTAIEKRFGDVSQITDDIARRMGQNISFPTALVEAVRGRDPALAKEIEGMLAPKEKTAPEEHEETATVSMEVETRIGKTPEGAVSAVSAGGTIEGEVGEASASGGYITTVGNPDYTASVDVTGYASDSASVSVGAYRDTKIQGADIAGYGGADISVSETSSVGLYAELGTSGGEKYVTISPTVAVEKGRVTLDLTPMVTVDEAGGTYIGAAASVGVFVSEHESSTVKLTGNFYQADMVTFSPGQISFAPAVTAGVSVSFGKE